MTEFEQENKKETNWELWFLIAFSLLLVVTFALYLPTWFALKSVNIESTHLDLDDARLDAEQKGMNMADDENSDGHPHDDDIDPGHGHERESFIGINIAYAAEHEDHSHDEDVDADHGHGEFSDEFVPWYVDSVWWTRFLISVLLAAAISLGVRKYIIVK